MFGEKHDLVDELPEFRDRMHHLNQSDPRFAHLFDKYHRVEHEVHDIEMGNATASDDYLEQRKRLRLYLKDQLFDMLRDDDSGTRLQ